MSNQQIQARLFDAIQRLRAPHAILITGLGDVDGLALRAAALHCLGHTDVAGLESCPDYYPLGIADTIPVDAVRALQQDLAKRSFTGKRAVVFFHAHGMNASAQNALLKTLEEPPENTLFLLTGNQAGLLATIRSRCATIRLGQEPEDEIFRELCASGIDEKIAALSAWLSHGAPSYARQIATQAHADFFDEAGKLFIEALASPVPLYPQAARLLDMPLVHAKDARSKSAKQRPVACFCLDIYLALLRDMLLSAYELPISRHNPMRLAVCEAARRFTIGQIQCIMESLLTARRQVDVANPSLAMDALMTRLACDQ